jgi:hypothetical protein
LRLLWRGWRRDRDRCRAASDLAARVHEELTMVTGSQENPMERVDSQTLLNLLDHAQEALLRSQPARSLDEISAWTASMRERIARRQATRDELAAVCRAEQEFFVRQHRLHRFPGAYLVKAFNLAIKGLHYETVMEDIIPQQQ